MRATELIAISPITPDHAAIERAVEVLRRGGLVAFPTETVYGLGADATNEAAVRSVFAAKGRPQDNPLIVHIAEIGQLHELGRNVPPEAVRLAQRFWPGPLTLVVQGRSAVAEAVTCGLDTVAVRMPDHRVPLDLIAGLGRPLVGPSANRSGAPSPTTGMHVYNDLSGKIDMVLDAGPAQIGLESTVLDVSQSPPAILRFGGLPREAIEEVTGPLRSADRESQRRSPGTRYRHYAPRARVVLFPEGDAGEYQRLIAESRKRKEKTAAILHTPALSAKVQQAESGQAGAGVRVLPDDARAFAHELFSALREADATGVGLILVESVKEEGLGKAVMDRLRRAAG